MRKTIFVITVVLGMLFCSMIQVAQSAPKAKAAEAKAAETKATETKTPEPKIEVKEVDGFWYAYEDYTGGVDTNSRRERINRVVAEMQTQRLDISQPSVTAYFNSLRDEKPENVKWAFGFVVRPGTTVKPPLKLMEIKKQKAVFHFHKGNYSEFPLIQDKMWEMVKKNKYKVQYPYYNQYLNSPIRTPPELLESNLVIPIKAK